MIPFSPAAEMALKLSSMEAEALQSDKIDASHVFLGICKGFDFWEASSRDSLFSFTGDQWRVVRLELGKVGQTLKAVNLDPTFARRRLRRLILDFQGGPKKFLGEKTDRYQDLLKLAEGLARGQKEPVIPLLSLFQAIIQMKIPAIDQLLKESGGKAQASQDHAGSPQVGTAIAEAGGNEPSSSGAGGTGTPYLDKFGRDLTMLARKGKLDPVFGRQEEIKKVAGILLRQKKSNPLLIGEPGVGKTCIIEGFAQALNEPKFREKVGNLRVIEISMGNLLAGTKFRGDFEDRIQGIINESVRNPDIVLFIDEIHTLVSAGSGSGDAMDAGTLMKPALARGEIKCIGATTTNEFRRYLEKDSALERRFQPIWIEEPTPEVTLEILRGAAPRLESHFGAEIPEEVMKKTVTFAQRYLPDQRFPDKALDLLDQALSNLALKSSRNVGSRATVTVHDLALVIAEKCRIPVGDLTEDEDERLGALEEELKKRIIGQDEAITAVAETIRAGRLGLRDQNRPLAVFLFAGSTGTGKTEMAKGLAEILFRDTRRLLRFDMSEYQESHSIARLIGSPPGYVGYEEQGQLTGKIRTHPYSVVLFDEIEKAHPAVFDLLLQVLDDGRLSDSHGRVASFAEAIIIFTSNLGGDVPDPARAIGLKVGQAPSPESEESKKILFKSVHEALKKHFRPEFLNRLGKIMVFNVLSRAGGEKILEKILQQANLQLGGRGLQLTFSPEGRDFLLDRGFNTRFGARELERTFVKFVNEPLARLIFKGDFRPGQTLKIIPDGNSIGFSL